MFSPAPGGGTSNTEGFTILPDQPGGSTTVDFDTPAPPGVDFDLISGVFEGLDFGATDWRWESAYGPNPTNHIYFDSNVGTSRTFQFASQPAVLTGMTVFAFSNGVLTLTDSAGQTYSAAIAPGSLVVIQTGWTLPADTVTVDFSAGWDLGVDDIQFQ